MIDDQFQEGFAFLEADDPVGAAHLWLEAWSQLCQRLPEDVRDLKAAGEVFLEDMGNCLFETRDVLHNLALDDPRLAQRGLAWCRELRARFTDRHRPMMEQEAEFLYMLGHLDEADALLTSMRNDDPDDPMPYAV